MNILVVSSFLPFPLTSGGHVRLFNIIKRLSARHNVTLVCEKRPHQTEIDVNEVRKICKDIITVGRKKQWSLNNILKTGFSTLPFLLVGHTNQLMKNAIKTLLHEKKFDVIHVETFYVMQNVPKTYLPVVLVEHNIEYFVYRRFLEFAPLILKPFILLDIKKIMYWEKYFWKKATHIVTVSEEEKEVIHQENVSVVPNGVDTKEFKFQNSETKQKKKEKRVLFIGDFTWLQNRNSAEWILKEIWPKVREKLKGEEDSIQLWVVGRKIPETLKSTFADEDVVLGENETEETPEIFKKSFALLAPIRVGGGTSFKILEAMASGVPVITTSLGAEGLGVTNGQELLIGETSDELSDHVSNIIKDSKLFSNISQSARIHAEKYFDWNIIVEKLEKVYSSVVEHH